METRGAKGILEFPLPEEQNRFDVACKSLDFALAWNQLKCWLRNEIKYRELPAEEYAAIHRVQNLVHRIETEFNLPELE